MRAKLSDEIESGSY